MRYNKGQFTIEFLVASSVFIVILSFSLSFTLNVVSNYRNVHNENYLMANALQISEMLLFDQGIWTGGVIRIGLADDYYRLSYDKMKRLNDTCKDDYDAVRDALNMRRAKRLFEIEIPEEKYVKIKITNSTRVLVNCGPEISFERFNVTKAEILRFATGENKEILNISIKVW